MFILNSVEMSFPPKLILKVHGKMFDFSYVLFERTCRNVWFFPPKCSFNVFSCQIFLRAFFIPTFNVGISFKFFKKFLFTVVWRPKALPHLFVMSSICVNVCLLGFAHLCAKFYLSGAPTNPVRLSVFKALAPKGFCTLDPPSKIMNPFRRSWNRL